MHKPRAISDCLAEDMLGVGSVDDEARRTLAQEAIALVNLSNPQKLITHDLEDTNHVGLVTPSNNGTESGATQPPLAAAVIHPLLQIKANLIARREGRMAIRKLTIRDPSSGSSSPIASTPTQDAQVFSKVTYLAGVAEQQSLEQPDKNISMKALLVTLKPPTSSPDADGDVLDGSSKLPSFRDVFESPRRQALSSSDLKCKYRTGKCTNIRALKSCGDYHNLCNYHRLRANANQRKLDRKKKVQRQNVTTTVPRFDVPSLNYFQSAVLRPQTHFVQQPHPHPHPLRRQQQQHPLPAVDAGGASVLTLTATPSAETTS